MGFSGEDQILAPHNIPVGAASRNNSKMHYQNRTYNDPNSITKPK